jgi:ribonuclease HII
MKNKTNNLSLNFDQNPILTCGVDEAGRGPLAGPVYAAAVILGDYFNPELNDSKKLTEKKRDKLALEIKEKALCWSIGIASAQEIDEINILQASLLAMKRAIEGLSIKPELALIDGIYCPKTGIESRAIIKGDSSEPCISAASILAKTARDAVMLDLHHQFPMYGFEQHKGYPTKSHLAALQEFGVIDCYRKSFGPVKSLISTKNKPIQR